MKRNILHFMLLLFYFVMVIYKNNNIEYKKNIYIYRLILTSVF